MTHLTGDVVWRGHALPAASVSCAALFVAPQSTAGKVVSRHHSNCAMKCT